MNLKTSYSIEGGILDITTNAKLIEPTTVKLTSKHKQSAQNKAQNMTEIFSKELYIYNKVTRIDAKKEKKTNFFNKHKNK
jgi:hypothetical protein